MCMGERIKERRIAVGLTQEELGEKLGLKKSAIAKYENGRVENIKREVIKKMANILDCSPVYLMGFSDDVHTPKEDSKYYLNPETAQIAQDIFDDPDLHALFDAAKDSKPENLRLAAEMLKRFKETNPDG